MQQNLKVRSANKHQLLFDGKLVGFLGSVDCEDDYGLEPQSGIGDIHVGEHVPTLARHRLNVQAVSLIKNNMRQLGIMGENGDFVLQGLVFDIVLVDLTTGAALKTYRGCSYASGRVEVRKNTVIIQSATFMALDTNGTDV
jgi:hypothetical protein